MRLVRRTRALVSVWALTAVAAGCSGTDAFAPEAATFSYAATWDAATQGQYTGTEARWSVRTLTGNGPSVDTFLYVNLAPAQRTAGEPRLEGASLEFFGRTAELRATRPAPGTYTMGTSAAGSVGAQLFVPAGDGAGAYSAESGSLTITRSSETGLEGTFEVVFAPQSGFQHPPISVTGTFTALHHAAP